MWRILFKILSYSAALFFAFMSFVVVVDLLSLARADRRLLEELKLRVSAVEKFRERQGRLPEESELEPIWSSLSPRDSPFVRCSYHVSKTEVPMPRRGGPVAWPASGGWALWVWLGESSEYYTSWNRRYSVEQSLSWFAVEGWILFSPVITVLLLLAPMSLRKKEPNQPPEPAAPSGRGSSVSFGKMGDNPELAALEFGQRVKMRALAVFGVPSIAVGLAWVVLLVPSGKIAEAVGISFFSAALFAWLAVSVHGMMIARFRCPACKGTTHVEIEKGDSTIFLKCEACARRWSLGLARPDENIP